MSEAHTHKTRLLSPDTFVCEVIRGDKKKAANRLWPGHFVLSSTSKQREMI